MNLSIVIPHYEKQEAFKKTWEALGSQLGANDEVIIIDDNSPNGPPKIEDERVRIKYLAPLKHHIYRLCSVRNKGVKKARNDAVAILDPDCIPNPDFVENAREVFDPAILFGGFIDYLDKNGEIDKLDPRANEDRISCYVDERTRGCAKIWGGCMMFSKSRVKKLGYFDERFNGQWGAEEHDFASRCYHSGMRLRHEEGLLVQHQYHGGLSVPKPKKPIHPRRNRRLWKKNMKRYFKKLNRATKYRPNTVVFAICKGEKENLHDYMMNKFRNHTPIKVVLIYIGKPSSKYRKDFLRYWAPRWAVNYASLLFDEAITKFVHKMTQKYDELGYENFIEEEI